MIKPVSPSAPLLPASFPDGGEPAWELAYLFPAQGGWTESDYFSLERACEGSARVELTDGRVEVLPMPTQLHEFILMFFLESLKAFVNIHAPGVVWPPGIKVRTSKKSTKYRKPDVSYMKAENSHRRHENYWDGADLAMEVVSPDPEDHRRDWEDKSKEYARAGISEYWIIDPQQRIIRVNVLERNSYRIHGDFGPGTQATSVLLPGFSISVDTALSPPGYKKQ